MRRGPPAAEIGERMRNPESTSEHLTSPHWRTVEPPRWPTHNKKLLCPRFHSHRQLLRGQLIALNVTTFDLPTLLAAAAVHPSQRPAVIRLTCAFLRKTNQLSRLRQEEEREEERPPNPVRVREYVETIVPLYSQEDFKKQFRMQIAEGNQRAWETVEELCRLLAPHLTTRILPVNKKVLATLWLLGNQESFRGVPW
ncbi:hypothetical protein GWK47_001861 [Chionoecetes opilio]|uniref:Uncharacterized protein n=1 Tax=Chionoecetes opilio TaxID=41210 RepID=A0A8J5CJQ1_CHIOP|nr:hypothetical protein GWK47_001861 [Chionoecetes opilio]